MNRSVMRLGASCMRVDLLAGTAYNPAAMPAPVPTILVFDSGLGGLTVFSEVLKARPDARFVYAADDAGFPVRPPDRGGPGRPGSRRHGAADRRSTIRTSWSSPATPPRPWCCRICARASRSRSSGTVPAIKPAAQMTRTGHDHGAGDPRHRGARLYPRPDRDLCGAAAGSTSSARRRLAGFAEAELAGAPVSGRGAAGRARALLRRGCRTGARTWWRSPAPITRCCCRASSALAPWPVDLDRPGAGHRPPGGAAHRRSRCPGHEAGRGRGRRGLHRRRRASTAALALAPWRERASPASISASEPMPLRVQRL